MTPSSHAHDVDIKKTRRYAREFALRILYQLDIGRQPVDEVLEAALTQAQLEGPQRRFAVDLVNGSLANHEAIDALLERHSAERSVDRLSAVDRGILRMAAYEMRYRPESQGRVICNEAIELARKYSTAESGRFINGVLASLLNEPVRTAALTGEDASP
ncbi:MAG: transcription antitermination factor NusB [Capsulimonadaceae bacterium]